jgi:hypothetical protein
MLKPTMDSPLIPQVNTFLALDSARASSGNLYQALKRVCGLVPNAEYFTEGKNDADDGFRGCTRVY